MVAIVAQWGQQPVDAAKTVQSLEAAHQAALAAAFAGHPTPAAPGTQASAATSKASQPAAHAASPAWIAAAYVAAAALPLAFAAGVWVWTRNLTSALAVAALLFPIGVFLVGFLGEEGKSAPRRRGLVPLGAGLALAAVLLVAFLTYGASLAQSMFFADKVEPDALALDEPGSSDVEEDEDEVSASAIGLVATPASIPEATAPSADRVDAESTAPAAIHAGEIHAVLARFDIYMAEGRYDAKRHEPIVTRLIELYRIPDLSIEQNQRLRDGIRAMNHLKVEHCVQRSSRQPPKQSLRTLRKCGDTTPRLRDPDLARLKEAIAKAERSVPAGRSEPPPGTDATAVLVNVQPTPPPLPPDYYTEPPPSSAP